MLKKQRKKRGRRETARSDWSKVPARPSPRTRPARRIRAAASGRLAAWATSESERPVMSATDVKGTSSTVSGAVAVAARDDDAVDAHARHGAA